MKPEEWTVGGLIHPQWVRGMVKTNLGLGTSDALEAAGSTEAPRHIDTHTHTTRHSMNASQSRVRVGGLGAAPQFVRTHWNQRHLQMVPTTDQRTRLLVEKSAFRLGDQESVLTAKRD